MKEDTYRSQFRLPYPLYERLKEAADANKKSLNAELVARLEESFSEAGPNAEALEGRLAALELKSMMSELSLSAVVLELLQRIPTETAEDRSAVRTLMGQVLDKVDSIGDVKQRFNELIKKLPTK